MTIDAKINYTNYRESNDVLDYCDNFINTMYNYDYFSFETKITVLTHGMLGDSNYWFTKDDNNKLYLGEECLPYKIISNFEYYKSNVPIILFEPILSESTITDVNFSQIILDENNYISMTPLQFNNTTKIVNLFKKHLVLIYDVNNDYLEIENNGASNEQIASYFRKSLNYFLSIYSIYNNNLLPRINLIGHSRGGITNLHYASKFEQIIDNLISIGTPFDGSIWAEVENSLNKIKKFKHPEKIVTNYDGLLSNSEQNSILFDSLIDPYKVSFNCEMTPSIFMNELITAIEEQPINDNELVQDRGVLYDILEYIRSTIPDNNQNLIEKLQNLSNGIRNIAQAGISLINTSNSVTDLLSRLPLIGDNIEDGRFVEMCGLIKNFLSTIVNLCNNIVNVDATYQCIKGDFCVDSFSQIALDFGTNIFDEIITIPFGISPYNNLCDEYLSLRKPGYKVVHNYESIHPEITSQINGILLRRNSIDLNLSLNTHEQRTINPYSVPFFLLSDSEIEEYYSCNLCFFDGCVDYRDYYYYEREILRNELLMYNYQYVEDQIIFTKRLRTGFIQNEKVVMSPNRENAGFAFIEFFFEEPVHILTFDTSLWSQNEEIYYSEQKYAFSTNEQFSDYIHANVPYYDIEGMYDGTMGSLGRIALFEYDDSLSDYFSFIDIATLPTNRQNPKKIYITSKEGFSYFGLYTVCNVTSFNKNKGRICLSNFELWF